MIHTLLGALRKFAGVGGALCCLAPSCLGAGAEEVLEELCKKYQAPTLPALVSENTVCYQVFILPFTPDENVFPAIITVRVKLGAGILGGGGSGLLTVHGKKKAAETALLGSVQLSEAEVKRILRTIGENEVFSLPMKSRVASYEIFPQLHGTRYVLVRKDSQGLVVVMRQDWNSVPVSTVVKMLGNFAIPFVSTK